MAFSNNLGWLYNSIVRKIISFETSGAEYHFAFFCSSWQIWGGGVHIYVFVEWSRADRWQGSPPPALVIIIMQHAYLTGGGARGK